LPARVQGGKLQVQYRITGQSSEEHTTNA
jgi:hypothetical protein